MRILLVDDSMDIVRLVKQVLELEGHEVAVARDGLEALQQVGSARPDGVVLDVNLPVLDGWEVCRRIKAGDPTIPIMMLTVRAERVDIAKGLEIGADAYLNKPFDIPDFVAQLKAMLRLSYSPERRAVRRFDPQAQFTNANGSTVWEALGRNASADSSQSVARISMQPGVQQRRRRNRFHEVLIVVSGTCTIELDGAEQRLGPNDVLTIPAGATYRERVPGPESCVAWAICTPAYHLDLVEYAE